MRTEQILKNIKTMSLERFLNTLRGIKPFYKKNELTQYYTEEGDVISITETENFSVYYYKVELNDSILFEDTIDLSWQEG